MRRPHTGKKMLAKDASNKVPLSKICTEHLNLGNKKTDDSIKKWAKDLKTQFIKEDILMAS